MIRKPDRYGNYFRIRIYKKKQVMPTLIRSIMIYLLRQIK